jgi:hypothetical protein
MVGYHVMMKKTIIKDEKYRGYVIKPGLAGFRIYRKGYYVGEYASKNVAKDLIDKVICKRKVLSEDADTPHHHSDPSPSDQLNLFS